MSPGGGALINCICTGPHRGSSFGQALTVVKHCVCLMMTVMMTVMMMMMMHVMMDSNRIPIGFS